ncbi:hypothetical protein EZS27_027504 [termite gut metagenome]|jgi:hypothetical protein|uniref:Uncharacterized protein n=1 Tax=termite gut metagenome TaxID=433724 RepID=A0A5J4QPN6_9ZZZZ
MEYPNAPLRKVISVVETLKNLPIGIEYEILAKDIKGNVLRHRKTLLERSHNMKFKITEAGLIDRVRITRLQ